MADAVRRLHRQRSFPNGDRSGDHWYGQSRFEENRMRQAGRGNSRFITALPGAYEDRGRFLTSTCVNCGRSSVSKVEEAGETVRLCRSCLDKRYPELQLGPLIDALIPVEVQRGACPNCGWTETELNKTGLVGCPLCYESLGDHVWSHF